MIDPSPVRRLREVEIGLAALSRELERMLGAPPANLDWWRAEIHSAIADIERFGSAASSTTHPVIRDDQGSPGVEDKSADDPADSLSRNGRSNPERTGDHRASL